MVFHALANRARRRILDVIRARPGCCMGDVCLEFDVSRIAVLKHVRVLEAAQLVIVRKRGRRRELYFNLVPIQMIYDRWTSDYSGFWAAKAVDLKLRVESDGQPRKSTRVSARRSRR